MIYQHPQSGNAIPTLLTQSMACRHHFMAAHPCSASSRKLISEHLRTLRHFSLRWQVFQKDFRQTFSYIVWRTDWGANNPTPSQHPRLSWIP